MPPHSILCLMGPTATGKTDMALYVARHMPIEIISVDSALIYRAMDVGTAKPSLTERAVCPHHLIDILNPDETYSVAEFVKQATGLIDAILARGNIPVLVGGTMLYFHALQYGLSPLPAANPTIRQELEATVAEKGLEALHQYLQHIDPDAAARIHPTDPQRLYRAIEVYRVTGEPLSTLQQRMQPTGSYLFQNYLLCPPQRAWLHERIATRFHQMITQGLVEEVAGICSRWPQAKGSPAMRAVGYRQVIAYLDGLDSLESCIEKGIIATRQLAKRQLTWLRSWPAGQVIDPAQGSNAFMKALNSRK